MNESLTKSGKYFTKFPHIDQYRHVIRQLRERAQYAGKDENGEPIFDSTLPLPTVNFTGTVKIHGTNASVCQRNNIRWYQSRNGIITPQNDNAGFAQFAENNTTSFDNLFKRIIEEGLNGNCPEDLRILIYGEWFGGNIQKGVAVSSLPKKFAIFEVLLLPDDTESFFGRIRLPKELFKTLSDHDHSIYNIYDFGEYQVDVDLSIPELAAETLTKLTCDVESECPVGKYFDVIGTGEGIVWDLYKPGDDNHQDFLIRFKTKGEKHSVTKVKSVKNLVTISADELKGVEEFLDYAVTEARLEQGIREVFPDEISSKQIRDFIRWVTDDTIREELDTIEKNKLPMKVLVPKIQEKSRNFILKKLKGN